MTSAYSANSEVRTRVLTALQRWQGSLDTADRPLFERFVQHAIDRLRGPYLSLHHPNQVLRHLELAFSFARVRDADDVLVRVQPGESKGIVALSVMPDQPFIVDTIRLFFRRNELDYWGGFNVVITTTRDENGRLIDCGTAEGSAESIVLLEANSGPTVENLQQASEQVRTNLLLAREMVRDFRAMTDSVQRAVSSLHTAADSAPSTVNPSRESANFLEWLIRDNFVFLGLDRVRDGAVVESLGIQKVAGAHQNSFSGDWPAPHGAGAIQVRKSAQESPIHRAGRIDEILVRYRASDGAEESLFLRGMFTYRAVTQPSRNVPILRQVLKEILVDSSEKPGSFRYKGIANVFDSLPTEFLFTTTSNAIQNMVALVFESEQLHEVGVTFSLTGEQSAFCLVAMPKSEFSDQLRRDLQTTLMEGVAATYSDHGVFVGRYETVLLHYFLTGVQRTSPAELEATRANVRDQATPWPTRLWQALESKFDEATADRLTDTWSKAFPEAYIRRTGVERTLQDIRILEDLASAEHPSADLFIQDGQLTLRLYEPVDIFLTDILPVLDDFGLVVMESYATEIRPRSGVMTLDTFVLAPMEGLDQATILQRRDLLIEALEAAFSDTVETDSLDALVMLAGISWAEVDMVRAYLRYMRQLKVPVALPRAKEILLSRPALVAAFVDLFRARFNPEYSDDREAAIERTWEAVDDHLRKIRAHDQDVVLRTMAQLIRHTLRTNFYRTDRVSHYLSFKFDIRNSPPHRDASHLYEIYVHSKDVEGVHIRFGPVARGGLRWSDRDDFRTEVLGLATTQQKKNVVIVPEGSKGGFYLRNPSQSRDERRQEADFFYQVFIRGLLDLTDNAVGGNPTRPPRVVCHDDFDPYLVVAADKGTAHLSDTANGISQSFGFWLDDAFASGGSNGYDHKAVGITARGAWVLARRHFAEMGLDPYQEEFTVVGIGDLGGDVFGNGLTETPHARLLAAFNHLHIFLDPNPDTKAAAAERERLFKIAGRNAGWTHYDSSLISEGGGVFERSARTIPLSPQVQEMLGLEMEEAPPNLVINHILKMQVDLLWNGGIGTYVKASYESQADADDRSNDVLRVDATELRCKIVGEGGNLGFTQQGRIEAGLHGVRLNTDAIDNSGGVDMSDHEVNLKILLSGLVQRGELTQEARNQLLEEMTEEVAHLVLENNNAHGRQISRDQIRSRMDIFQFAHAITFVERTFGLRRDQIDLPSHAELTERAARGEGLTRPELAVLGAYVKMYVYRELMAGKPKKIPGFSQMLREYFPKRIQKDYGQDIKDHMLAKEIAMTVATTKVIADGGATLVPIMIETTGAGVQEIVTAFLKAERLARMQVVRSTLEELRTTVSLTTLSEGFVRIVEGARMASLYWLSAKGRVPTDSEITQMLEAIDSYTELQATEASKRARAVIAELVRDDIPERVGDLIVKSRFLNLALMAWSLSKNSNADLAPSIIKLQAIGGASGLLPLIEDLAVRPASGSWEPIALRILFVRFLQLLRQVIDVVDINVPIQNVDQLQNALTAGAAQVIREQVDDLLTLEDERPSPATLLVLEERVAAKVARMNK